MASALAWTAARNIITAALPAVPLLYANEGQQAADADLFVQVLGRAGDSEAGEVGRAAMWTETGAIECLIHARLGTGSLAARECADTIVSAFRAVVAGVIEWVGWQLDEATDPAEGGFWVIVLTVRYRTQTITT